MGRKLSHLLIFFFIILKEPNLLEADCSSACKSSVSSCRCNMIGLTSIPQDLPTSISTLNLNGYLSNITSLTGIVLAGSIILTKWCKRKTKNPSSDQHPKIVSDDSSQLSMAQLAALKSNPLYGDSRKNRLQQSDGAGSVKSLEHPNGALAEALSNTKTTSTVTAVTNEDDSHHYEDIDTQNDQTRHGQAQAIIESNKHNTASVNEMINGNGQKGQDPSQATSQSLPLDVTNLSRNALLAALQPNPMYLDVKTATKDPHSSEMSSVHDQTGQGQSQAFTESNIRTTATALTSSNDQTGHGQSAAELILQATKRPDVFHDIQKDPAEDVPDQTTTLGHVWTTIKRQHGKEAATPADFSAHHPEGTQHARS
uniref:Uncharacterized protein n=1 Tax=Branchiostoma floridae TaxID=7739 RepID=C3XV28_BRAFL|eukprot:XP_002611945.1 hypothetical protein BRAFLDRAFT_91829 [Branchiostoma floridae]